MDPTLSRMKAYLRLSESVSRARASAEVCEAALDCVREQLGIERSAILAFDALGVMRFRAFRGISERYRKAVEGHSPWTPGTRDAEPILIADVELDATLGPLLPAVREEGIGWIEFVPLRARGRLIGKLMLYGSGPARLGSHGLDEAVAVADLIAAALDGHQAQERLREVNDLLSTLMEDLPEALAFVDASGRVRYNTRRCEDFFGISAFEMRGASLESVVARVSDSIVNADALWVRWRDDLAAGRPTTLLFEHVNGRRFELSSLPTPKNSPLAGWLVRARDVTERQDLEARLLHAHKMESIGRLAGGVAHDFNNMLTAMIGYMDLVAAGLPPGAEEHLFITAALEAADQASDLTRQLLAFARRQPVQPTAQDVNALLERMAPLLRRLVPENVEIVTRAEARPGWVLADAGQLEQVLVNLAFNARDAMPDGGRLTLSTTNALGAALQGAEAVVLEVADTGVGMDAETRAHVFEPFYTTKPEGLGAGLGLATVYGIVQQFGGQVEVVSEPGRGASFRVLLPPTPAPAASPATAGVPRGSETVLLVEDDSSVRGLVTAMLGRLGYVVLVAERADEALALLEHHAGDVDLLIADIVMPGMSGRELATRALVARPHLRVLLTSGHATTSSGTHVAAGFEFMPKPFSIETLARRVREALAVTPAAALAPGPPAR
jgi:PAS domain S-box-containing protein